MLICQKKGCKKLANMTSGFCHEHEKKRPLRRMLGGAKGQEILAIMVGDKLTIGKTNDDEGVVYDIVGIEGDDSNAQIYLQDETDHTSPKIVIHYRQVD